MSSEPTVYVSYAREDLHYAREIEQALLALGARVWIDRDQIAAGDDWVAAIDKALTESDFIFLLVSRDYRRESFANYERALALKLAQTRARPNVVTVLLPGAVHSELPASLMQFAAVDARHGVALAIGELRRALSAA